MARSDPQINIRIPTELRDLLEEARAQSSRSLTAEISHRLSESFRKDALLKQLEERNEQLFQSVVKAQKMIAALDDKFANSVAGIRALAEQRWADAPSPEKDRVPKGRSNANPKSGRPDD